MKKSNNPFKMWGSWVGAIIYAIINIEYNMEVVGVFCGDMECRYNISNLNILDIILMPGTVLDTLYNLHNVYFNIIFTCIVGFLIGWGIHYLIRRYLK